MTEPEGLAGPAAAVIKQGKEKAVPQPGAGIEDGLHFGGCQDPRQLLWHLQRDLPAAIGHALAHVMQERLPCAPPPRPPRGRPVTALGAAASPLLIERPDSREL